MYPDISENYVHRVLLLFQQFFYKMSKYLLAVWWKRKKNPYLVTYHRAFALSFIKQGNLQYFLTKMRFQIFLNKITFREHFFSVIQWVFLHRFINLQTRYESVSISGNPKPSLLFATFLFFCILFLVSVTCRTCYTGQQPDSGSGGLQWSVTQEDPSQCTKYRLGGLNTRPHQILDQMTIGDDRHLHLLNITKEERKADEPGNLEFEA